MKRVGKWGGWIGWENREWEYEGHWVECEGHMWREKREGDQENMEGVQGENRKREQGGGDTNKDSCTNLQCHITQRHCPYTRTCCGVRSPPCCFFSLCCRVYTETNGSPMCWATYVCTLCTTRGNKTTGCYHITIIQTLSTIKQVNDLAHHDKVHKACKNPFQRLSHLGTGF